MNVKAFSAMTQDELQNVYAREQAKLDKWSERNLTLDLTRGKPNQAQLDLSSEMLSIISDRGDCFSASGLDCRNYGILDGLPETKKLFSDLLDIPAEQILRGHQRAVSAVFLMLAAHLVELIAAEQRHITKGDHHGAVKILEVLCAHHNRMTGS